MDDKPADKLTATDLVIWDGADRVRDARSAWNVIRLCDEYRMPLPAWVLRYLGETAQRMEAYLEKPKTATLKTLKDALDFNNLHDPPKRDFDADPETVFDTITTWIHDETMPHVNNASQGWEHYADTILKQHSVSRIQDLYDDGRKIVAERRAMNGGPDALPDGADVSKG